MTPPLSDVTGGLLGTGGTSSSTSPPVSATPAQQALAAAVPAARGWFRYGTELGAVNVRQAAAVQAVAYDDGQFRIMALGAQVFELQLGPYATGEDADAVVDAVLRLAYNDVSWPNS